MTISSWIGRKLLLEIAEPFEYGFESNPFPLEASIIAVSNSTARHYIAIRTNLVFEKNMYNIGALRSRYVGLEHALDVLEVSKFFIANMSFAKVGHERDARLLRGDFSDIIELGIPKKRSSAIPRDWANFIGAVELA